MRYLALMLLAITFTAPVFAEDRNIRLTWQAAVPAPGELLVVSQDVGWSTTSGPPYTLSTDGGTNGIEQDNIELVDATALSHLLEFRNLTPGTTLYFAVRRCDENGVCSEWSTEDSHTVVADADVPNHEPSIALPVLRTDGENFRLIWGNPRENTGDKAIEYFEVGSSDVAGGPYTFVTVASTTLSYQWQFPGLSPGDTKFFVVQACTANGYCSDVSAELSHAVTVDAVKPNPPQFITHVIE